MGADWKFTHISVPGPRHQTSGVACEDASHAFWHESGQSVVLVAADGAGSARFASVAAVHVVESISTCIATRLRDEPAAATDPARLQECLRASAQQARAGLDRMARGGTDGVSIDDYSTTLLIAVCNDSILGALQVGDGHIVTMRRDSTCEAVFRPSKGRHINETCFLSSYDSFDELDRSGEVQIAHLDASDMFGVALVTDGLDPLLPDRHSGRHPGFFLRVMRRLWQDEISVFEQNVEDFLSNSARLREVSDDDKTLAIAVRADVSNLLDEPAPSGLGIQTAPHRPASRRGEVPKVIPVDGPS